MIYVSIPVVMCEFVGMWGTQSIKGYNSIDLYYPQAWGNGGEYEERQGDIIELRPYQSELITNIRNSVRTGHRSIVSVLGCGGGKSVIQAEIARSATEKGNRVWRSLVSRLNGVQEAASSSLVTRTRKTNFIER